MREQRRQCRQVIGIASLILTIALAFSAMLLAKNREIGQKNQELAQQKEEVQLRELELLVHDAEEALAEGDSLSAILSDFKEFRQHTHRKHFSNISAIFVHNNGKVIDLNSELQ